MTQNGKLARVARWTTGAAAAALLAMGSSASFAQNAPAPAGNLERNWKAPDKPGDGVAETVIADGVDPGACRIAVSVKGNACTKVICKGEQAVFTNSSQSIMAAKRISMSVAKAHYVHFLQEEINSKRATDTIDAALKKEGTADAGTSASSGYVTSQSIREQASALIKGFAVIEDGVVTDEAGGKVAYTIGGVSCVTQRAADTLKAGNATDTAAGRTPDAQGNRQQEAPANSRRRALDNM